MTLQSIEHLFSSDPVATLKSGLRFVHFVGLALGLGAATLLDLLILRYCLRGRIEAETFKIFVFSTRVIGLGLRILWITGVGFLFLYALFDKANLYNPKVHAKLVIVAILSLNGVFIHSFILPILKAQVGKSLFDGISPVKRSLFVTSGAVSAVSWYVPVALGVFSQLNFAVPALTLLSVYLLLIAVAALIMNFIMHLMDHDAPPPALQPAVQTWTESRGQRARRRQFQRAQAFEPSTLVSSPNSAV